MSWFDALIGTGSALAGGVLTYAGAVRDRRQRTVDAREDRDYASRREACLLLERQRTRQLEVDTQFFNQKKFGGTVVNPDHSDLQNSEVDAMVSLFLPDRIEQLVIDLNARHDAFIRCVNAVDAAPQDLDRARVVEQMATALSHLVAGSDVLRQALREEARSR